MRSEYPLPRTCSAPLSPSQMKRAAFMHCFKVPLGIFCTLLRYRSKSQSKVRSQTPATWSAAKHSGKCHRPRSSGRSIRQSECHNLAQFLHCHWDYTLPTVPLHLLQTKVRASSRTRTENCLSPTATSHVATYDRGSVAARSSCSGRACSSHSSGTMHFTLRKVRHMLSPACASQSVCWFSPLSTCQK